MKPPVVKQMILLAVGLLLLAACKPKVPKEYIQPDEMESKRLRQKFNRLKANDF